MAYSLLLRRLGIGVASLICGVLILGSPVSAEDTPTSDRSSADAKKLELRQKLEAEHKAAVEKRQDLRAQAKGRLDEAKRKICENRLNQIKRILSHTAQKGNEHLGVFDRISERVQNFYKTKGLSVSNYDALVSDVEAKRAAAVAVIESTKNTTFDCSDENAVGKADVLRNTVKAQHQALKEYRTSIKNLMVAVKKAAETQRGTN